jgi:WD40 repeat protein
MVDGVVNSHVEGFESASELRDGHAQLLEALDRQLGEDASATAEVAALSRLEPMIRTFLQRGAATGVYLDEVKERTACQVLLDYWVSSLAQAAMGAPPARLAAFDGDKLPDLKDKPCPYVGLDAFRGRQFFFGRESDTQALLDQIRGTALVVVVGASGSGKSSLVMGGVLPALADDQAEVALRVAPTIVPGTTVLEHLAEAVLQASGDASASATHAAAKLNANAGYLSEMAGKVDAGGLLITIDQFEEVFTLGDVVQREALAAGLAALLESDQRHRVILTMREEFRSRLVELRALSRFLERAWYSMRPMGYEELRAAVERPATLVNLQFQSGIVDDLVKKVLGQPAALPLLQFTLRTLWDRRDRNRITWEVYDRVGDPLNALKASADQFFDALALETQTEARRVILQLVRVDELLEAYRQPVPKSRLLQAGKANTEEVLRLLTRNDYLRMTAGTRDEDAIVEVKHESLIRNWPRLVTWIDEKRIERRQRIALTQATQRWAQSGKPGEGLLTGWQLEEAKRQLDLSELEREFVEASAHQIEREQREREQALQRELAEERRRARLIGLLALAVSLMIPVILNSCRVARNAEYEARLALGQASTQEAIRLVDTNQPGQALAHLARTLRSDPDALAAWSLTSDLLINQGLFVARTSLQHQGVVKVASFSPDGGRVVTASADSTARVWDAATGQPVGPALRHKGAVNAAVFRSDGRHIVTASADATAQVWDSATGQPVGTPLQHEDTVNAAVFSPNGALIVTASADATARVWIAATGKLVGTPFRHLGSVNTAAFSHDGHRVVTASADATARVWDTDTGRPIGAPLEHVDIVNTAVFSPDGSLVITASDDKTARVWEVATGQPVGAPLQHQRAVLAAAFSSDGRRVVTASSDTTARIWDAATGKPVGRPLEHQRATVSAAEFSSDGSRVVTASSDGTARVWSATTGQPIGVPLQHPGAVNEGAVNAAAFSPDGSRVVTASHDKTARVWDAAKGRQVVAPPLQGKVKASVFGPNGPRFLMVPTAKDAARVWDAIRGLFIGVPLQHRDVNSAAFSSDGRLVVTASADATGRVWDAATGQPVGAPLQHQKAINTVAFSSDGRHVVTASADATARVWDTSTGQPVGTPLQHQGAVNMAAFSSDGRRLVTVSADSTVRIWNTTTGKPVGAPFKPNGAFKAAVFGPDGPRVVIVSDTSTRVWDPATALPVGAPLQDGNNVKAAALSPDGRLVITASVGTTARVWDAASGQPVGAPIQHGRTIFAVAFSSDGHWVVIDSDDGSTRIWQVLLYLSSGESVQRLADLAEVVGGYRVTELSSVVPLEEPERLRRVDRLAGHGATAFVPYEVLLRPFLDAWR